MARRKARMTKKAHARKPHHRKSAHKSAHRKHASRKRSSASRHGKTPAERKRYAAYKTAKRKLIKEYFG